LDWYRTANNSAGDSHDDSRHTPLPDKMTLLEQMEMYNLSAASQLFPIINPACFEYTIRAAYDLEPSDLSPGISSARACVFAFMAMSAFNTNYPHRDTIIDTDRYARAARDLLPEVFGESVTLDGLQTLLTLVRLVLFESSFKH
jgi:hypothetical protein